MYYLSPKSESYYLDILMKIFFKLTTSRIKTEKMTSQGRKIKKKIKNKRRGSSIIMFSSSSPPTGCGVSTSYHLYSNQ
ncbi:unnamed protein product [Coffea canephora]|uniref:DH200=94 genomic scaffold, scaffold_5022 n=1 Tax=Coffea canephora TaxID=49390 RepID=A0A068VPE5_COFCA|nr:unnamed protein product [Coffea canephora]